MVKSTEVTVGISYWQILKNRLESLKLALTNLENEMQSLERTSCNSKCYYCGQVFKTEMEYEDHYIMINEYEGKCRIFIDAGVDK